MSTVDLGVTKESTMELKVMCDLSPLLCVCVSVTTRATSVVEGRKEGVIGKNSRKEYHSTSKARKVRSKIVASYCNILKVSQVLTFSTLGRCSFPFYRRMEGAPRLTYGTTKVHNL